MKYWSRDDTKEWVAQLENRLEDIGYYLQQTVDWCEENSVYDDQQVFACAALTVIWVSHMRGERLTKKEMFELIGIQGWEDIAEDLEYSLGSEWAGYELEEILDEVVNRF